MNETERLAGMDDATRTGLQAQTLRQAVLDNLVCLQGKYPDIASPRDWYMALAYTVRDRMLERWVSTVRTYAAQDVKVVCYLSAEFLIGPQLGNNLVNLGIEANARAAMEELGQDLDVLVAIEEEPGLGNGGLGRLAACYLDSLATLEVPAIGYGLRYEFGIFDQEIRDGAQVEVTDKWLQKGNAWEIPRPDDCFYVSFGGHTESYTDEAGRYRVRWIPAHAGQGHGLRHPGARLPRQHLQHPPAVAERGGRVVRLPGLQRRRLLRRGPGEGGLRDDLEGALSERRAGDRAAPAAGAAVFLRLLLAAGHAAPARPEGRPDRPPAGPCSRRR